MLRIYTYGRKNKETERNALAKATAIQRGQREVTSYDICYSARLCYLQLQHLRLFIEVLTTKRKEGISYKDVCMYNLTAGIVYSKNGKEKLKRRTDGKRNMIVVAAAKSVH